MLIFLTWADRDMSVTEYTETVINPDASTTRIVYSYQKYYNRSGIYEEINESFYPCGRDYCTRNYMYRARIDQECTIYADSGDLSRSAYMKVSGIFGSDSPYLSRIEGSVATCEVIEDYVYMTYQYLPQYIKETITLNKSLYPDWYWERMGDFIISYRFGGDTLFHIPFTYMYDEYGAVSRIRYERNMTNLVMHIDGEWIGNGNRSEMIYIDPPVTIVLNASNITLEAIIQNYTTNDFPPVTNYQLNTAPANLRYGLLIICNPFCFSFGHWRTDLETDTRAIPDDADIIQLDLHLYSKRAPDNWGDNRILQFMSMENNGSYHIPLSNESYYADMGNGTKYHEIEITRVGFYVFDLINASDDFTVRDSFALGMTSKETGKGTVTVRDGRFAVSTDATPSHRPFYNVTYFTTDVTLADNLYIFLISLLWILFIYLTYETGKSYFNIAQLVTGLVLATVIGAGILVSIAIVGVSLAISAGGFFYSTEKG